MSSCRTKLSRFVLTGLLLCSLSATIQARETRQNGDANGDGMISPDEFGGRLVAMFTRMDADRDGLLSGDELPRRMSRHGHQGAGHDGRWGREG